MKFAKKLMSVLLVVLMIASLAVPAMADATGPFTITIKNTSTVPHTYKAYQIFTGTLSDDETLLTSLEWGSGINSSAFLTKLANDTDFGDTFDGKTTADDIAAIIKHWTVNSDSTKRFAHLAGQCLTTDAGTSVPVTGGYKIEVTKPGYYLVKDVDASLQDKEDTATDYLLQIVANVEISPKSQMPTFTYGVSDHEAGPYGAAADNETNGFTYHRMLATLPGSFNDYDQYHLHFQAIIPEGLTVDAAKANIKVNIVPSMSAAVPYAGTWDVSLTGQTLTIELGDLKKSGVVFNLNDTIEVIFKTTVNPSAITGLKGEDVVPAATDLGNVVVATMNFSNDMNQPEGTPESSISHGAISKKASVYTYQLEITKVDSVNTEVPLPGAQFKLFRNVGSPPEAHYAKLTGSRITDWTTDKDEATILETPTNGKILVEGLGSAIYHLEEVKAPSGYEPLPTTEQITITGVMEGQALSSLTGVVEGVTVTGKTNIGQVAGKIRNTQGTGLPATGGMGTTIFYVAGAVLLLGSLAAYAVKKRNEEE